MGKSSLATNIAYNIAAAYEGEVQADVGLVLARGTQIGVLDLGAGVVAEAQQVFGQLLVQRVIIGLIELRVERRALRQPNVVRPACRVDAVVARQALVVFLQQLAGRGLVLLAQGGADFGPQRAVRAGRAAAGVLLPQEAALGVVLPRVLEPADRQFRRGVRVVAFGVPVHAHQLAQHVARRIAGLLLHQQPRTGDAPRGIQPFFGEPFLACLSPRERLGT